ncbi:MAG: threonine synthase [Candidatus Sulfotelmatobacter sp.]
MAHYELRCRECGRSWGNQPRSICDECFSPLEVNYDYDAIRALLAQGAHDQPRSSRERISQRPPNMWRYAELLPLPEGFEPRLPVGFTPLFQAPRLAQRLAGDNDAKIAGQNLYLKNDAVCLPTLSFKDRVVAVALAQAKAFGFDTVACSSTGNLANAVAAHAARLGLKAWIFIPSDLEPAKILGTQVFGANVVRIAGNYDQVNRLCSQIAEERRWGFVNVNLRPYYAEGSKTVGFEIAEQLGWRLPDNVVVPMAGGSLITKIKKAFGELIKLRLVEEKPVKFFGAQATGCSPISTAVKIGSAEIDPQKPSTIARSLAIGNPADGHYAIKTIKQSGGWSEDVSDPDVIDSIRLLAETEGVFTETAGGVTVGTAGKLYRQDRILAEETTVLCITGNGWKTTDVLAGVYEAERPIAPKLAEFEKYLQQAVAGAVASETAIPVGA